MAEETLAVWLCNYLALQASHYLDMPGRRLVVCIIVADVLGPLGWTTGRGFPRGITLLAWPLPSRSNYQARKTGLSSHANAQGQEWTAPGRLVADRRN